MRRQLVDGLLADLLQDVRFLRVYTAGFPYERFIPPDQFGHYLPILTYNRIERHILKIQTLTDTHFLSFSSCRQMSQPPVQK